VLDWRTPFRVTNFMYVTNPETKIFLVYDSSPGSQDLLERLRKLMPAEIGFEEVSLGDLSKVRNQNYARAHFIFLGFQQSLVGLASRFRDTEVRGVSVLPGGRIVFGVLGPRGEKTKEEAYVGDELLMGAIMSGDALYYHCNAITAFTRLAGVASVYQQRVNELQVSTPDRCKPLYAVIAAESQGKPAPFEIMTQESLQVVMGGPIIQAAGAVSEASLRLYTTNEQLLRKSCPTVY
jgi:hypothetical protein